MYSTSQYRGGPLLWYPILQQCALDTNVHQPAHQYALYQANAYVDGVLDYTALIDELALSVEFTSDKTGPITLVGYPINLNRLMFDVFSAIADDEAKLAIYQSTIGGATDLRGAAAEARKQAAYWLKGTIIPQQKLMGRRRWL
jgi:hypothetical protein